MTLAFLFLLGLVVGSFLNVLVVRLETGETVLYGRSRCNVCRRTIRWYDNVPVVSYLLLQGKCRDCGEPISIQYPLVELATGLLFLAAGVKFSVPGDFVSAIELVYICGLVSALIVIFVYDLRHMEIPVSVLEFAMLWIAVALGALFFLDPMATAGFWDSRIGEGIVGGALAFLFFWAIVFFSRETWMGWGDVWLAFILGLALGWKLLLPTLTLAFGTGAIVGLALIALHRKGMKSRIPFGPFLVTAMIFMLFFGRMVEERLFYLWW